ncbi:MAG: NYN domain-containing protein [Bacteroidaceae bacterium]|nr:NYN domain-containing protein [Bacteroidaceae bacterium]
MKKAKARRLRKGVAYFLLYYMEKKKVIVYVDGFNFYYGLKASPKWKKYYWLDIVGFFEKFLKPNQELVAVKYFSARPDDPVANANQGRFFQANKENNKFRLILGTYLKKNIVCRNCGFIIKTHEEKETDVRIATQIVADAYEKNCDIAIVVSADSDMVPAIEIAKGIGQTVFVYFPPNQHSSNLATMGSGSPIFLQRYESRFKQSLLPDVVHLKSFDIDISIPEKWKNFQNK